MDLAEFSHLALRTERPVDTDVCERFERLSSRVHRVLMDAVRVADEADGIKRALFYGKDDRLKLDNRELFGLSDEELARMAETLRAIHGILGVVSEAGELISAYSNYWHGEAASIDVVNVLEEVGDAGWYHAIICNSVDSNVDEAYTAIIRKLEHRQKEKFTEQEAVERDLAAERRALESSIHGEGLF